MKFIPRQLTAELKSAARAFPAVIDAHPERKGQWFITGSQEAPLMQGVTESMAGRAASSMRATYSLLPNASPSR